MNIISLDSYEATEKLTARVFFNPFGDGFKDMGNVQSWARAKSRELRTRARSESGVRIVDREEVDLIHDAWEFVHDQFDQFNNRLINDVDRNNTAWVDQDSASASTETIQDVYPGCIYFAGKRALSSFALVVSTVTMTLGTDYTVNLDTGEIKILESGSILAGQDIDLTYDVDERGLQQYTMQESFDFLGATKFQFFNTKAKEPLYVVDGTASCNITTFPEHAGEFATFGSRFTFTSNPTITKRNAYNTLSQETS